MRDLEEDHTPSCLLKSIIKKGNDNDILLQADCLEKGTKKQEETVKESLWLITLQTLGGSKSMSLLLKKASLKEVTFMLPYLDKVLADIRNVL